MDTPLNTPINTRLVVTKTPLSQTQPLLAVRDLSRTFGSGKSAVTAVKGVSLELYPGEIVALVGESGSGKSTLARLLLRLLAPTSGSIELSGRDVTKGPKRAYWRKVQAVFQDPVASFNQFYSVRRVLLSALGVLEKRPEHTERDTRLKAALAQVGLAESLLEKRPYELSGGQRQRVMIARALMLAPQLLIADEPTSMLDASLRVSILNQLRDVRDATGTTLLLITHDLGQAYYVSDRLLVMYKGEIVESGPTVTAALSTPCDDRIRCASEASAASSSTPTTFSASRAITAVE